MNLLAIIFIFLLIQYMNCARILGVFPAPGYSQFILGEKLMTELANRGHDVTVISPYSPKIKISNYKTILTTEIVDLTKGEDLFELEKINTFQQLIHLYDFCFLITETTLKNPKVQNLLKSNESFDVVIVELIFTEALMGFSQYFNAPLILFSSIGPCEWTNHFVGNPALPSINPAAMTSYSNKMNFFQRFNNLITILFHNLYEHLVALPKQRSFVKKYFPNSNKIELNDIIYNVSLLLTNSHLSTTGNVPTVKGIVEIGGFHVTVNKLPEDVQKFLDNSENGAIYFSMGSNLNSTNFSKDKINAIFGMFSKLKQRVLWKFENDQIENKPDNIFISKWLPQSDILAHPNIRLFISHGGLLSTTEAVFHGVPMIGIPIFGDQKMNIAKACQNGFAIHLPFQELNAESLQSSINEILHNPVYRKNSKKWSNVLKDQAVKPLDLAMFWIEHVLRHKGAPHLRSPTLNLYWFQTYMLDILFFVLLILFVLIKVTKYIFKIVKTQKVKTE